MSHHFTFDIQAEIMKRLPVKSLIQFRLVCKEWKSLIDSSEFIAGYSENQPQHLMTSYRFDKENGVKHACFVYDDTFPQQKFALTVPPLVQETTLIGSSHGLLCLTGYSREQDDSSRTQLAVIWNPTIRKSIAIVVPSRIHPLSHYVIGFGVCPETKDPKIVNIINDFGNSCEEVMIFTLRSEEWRCLCSNALPRKSINFRGFQVVIDQFIYWLIFDENDEDDERHNSILSFDLSMDEFRELHLPETLWQKSDLVISKRRESLVVLDYGISSTTDKQVCDVWMMMEHGDSKVFTKLFTIKAPDEASVDFWIDGFRNNGEAIIGMQGDDDEDEDEHMFPQSALVVYDPCLEHVKGLVIRGPSNSFHGSSYTYTESLFLLNHDDGRIVT